MTLIEVLSVFDEDVNAKIESISFLDKDMFEIEACFKDDDDEGTPQVAKIMLYPEDCDLSITPGVEAKSFWIYNSTLDFFEKVRSTWNNRNH